MAGSASGAALACGQTITQNTTLTSDLGPCPGDGLVIGADNVTLDLNGHTVSGTGPGTATGVDLNGHSRVTVRDGTITGFFTQVQLGQASPSITRASITGLNFVGGEFALNGSADRSLIAFNRSAATRLPDQPFGGDMQIFGAGDTVTHNAALNNLLAVVGADNEIDQNHVSTLSVGASPQGGDVAADNVAEQVLLGGGDPNAKQPSAVIIRNELVPPSSGQVYEEGGIIIQEASHMFIADNTVTGPPPSSGHFLPTGIWFSLLQYQGVANGDVLIRNVVKGASGDGISIVGPSYFGPPNNQILFNSGATNTLLLHNRASHNGRDGIDNQAPTSTLTNNIANFNGNLGIESVPAATDAGGNRARGNANAAQCLNVACR